MNVIRCGWRSLTRRAVARICAWSRRWVPVQASPRPPRKRCRRAPRCAIGSPSRSSSRRQHRAKSTHPSSGDDAHADAADDDDGCAAERRGPAARSVADDARPRPDPDWAPIPTWPNPAPSPGSPDTPAQPSPTIGPW